MGDDNWLDAAIIACPSCGAQLFRVIHSPFCDDNRLYCDSCPCAIEVGYYDPEYTEVINRLEPGPKREQIMAAMEPLLKPCKCGGRFRDTSPRHCFACGAVVPEAAGHDLYPYIGCEGTDRDPTTAEQEEYDRFDAGFIRRTDLWEQVPD
jgi:hypothetical protein